MTNEIRKACRNKGWRLFSLQPEEQRPATLVARGFFGFWNWRQNCGRLGRLETEILFPLGKSNLFWRHWGYNAILRFGKRPKALQGNFYAIDKEKHKRDLHNFVGFREWILENRCGNVCGTKKEGDTMAKRRSNGEGNIRKRKDGRWEGRYTVGRDPVSGKQVFKNVLGKTQAEVKEKMKLAIEKSKKVDFQKTGKYTVTQWMDEWFENVCKLKVRPSSHQTYRGYIDNHITPYIGQLPIEKLSTMELQKLYRKLMTKGRVERIESEHQPKGLSAKTVRNIHQVISSAMDFAVAQKIISENPCKVVALPKVEHREMQTIPAKQLRAFLVEAKASGVYEMYYTELATGLRRGELLGLKWSDIDLESGIIRVMRQVARVDGQIVEAPLKTKNSYRTVAISQQAVEVLRQQKAKTNDEYVFPSPNGGPISPDSVNNMLKRVLARAGIPRVRFHDLRHTFATVALQNGVDIKTVSGMLGHFSAGFTLDTYAHVTTAAQKEAAQTMGNVLSL